MNAITELLITVVVLAMIVGAIVFMFNPTAGGEIFKRLAIVLLVLLLGVPFAIGLVREFVRSLWPFWFFLLLVGISVGAYFIRESLAERSRKPPGKPYGAERTPVLPNISQEKKESDGDDSAGAG